MKVKIEIKHWITGSVLFEYESEDNTLRNTVLEAIRRSADLRSADLSYANLSSADLRSADLSYANLSYANLSSADLRSADLSSANLSYANLSSADLSYADLSSADLSYANLSSADLRSANLRYANLSYANLSYAPFEYLPKEWIALCAQQMLFIFNYTKQELPDLRRALLAGTINGSQYAGECCCLVGTLAKDGNKKVTDNEVEEYCSTIPYYTKGTHNPAEQWFLNIHEGDTPKNNKFAKFALGLVDKVIKESKKVSHVKKS